MLSEDYVASTFTLEFDRCQNRSCVNLTIVDDNVLELDESFHVSLESIQALNNHDKLNRIHITPAKAEINIIDEDGGDCTYVTNSNALILLCLCRSDDWSGGIRIYI